MGNTPFPLPSHRTGLADFPHPALRLTSPQAHGGRPLNLGALRRHRGRYPPSPRGRACSEGSGSLSVLLGSSPITSTSPCSQACQKSGSFAPPALPSFNARTTLSDSRLDRRLKTTLRPQPSPRTGLPRLPGTPFRRAVPTTPADRAGASVDFSPLVLPSPNGRRVGIRIVTFEACSGFTLLRPAGSLSRPRRPLSRGFSPAGYPNQAARQLPDLSTIIRVDPSSTGVPRLRGALPIGDIKPLTDRRRFPHPRQLHFDA